MSPQFKIYKQFCQMQENNHNKKLIMVGKKESEDNLEIDLDQ